MKNSSKIHTILVLLIILIIMCNITIYGDEKETKHILFIDALSPSYQGPISIINSVKDYLSTNEAYNYSYSYEFLDIKSFTNDEQYMAFMFDTIQKKYKDYKPDIIVTNEQDITYFEGNELFQGVPVVVNWNFEKQNTLPTYYYSIPSIVDFEKNIALIRTLHPKAGKIYIITDEASQLEGKVEVNEDSNIIVVSDITTEELIEEVKTITDKDVILFNKWLVDKNGKREEPSKIFNHINEMAKAPIYINIEQRFGTGAVGGYVSSPIIVGETAGKLVEKILMNEQANMVSRIYPAENTLIFDYRALKRWKINIENLNQQYDLKFNDISLYEKYKGFIWGILIFIIFQSFLILLLINNIRMRKRVESKLLVTNTEITKLNSQLRKQDKNKDDFLMIMSNELTIPVNCIINIVESLMDQNYGHLNSEQKNEMLYILSIINRVKVIISDLVDIEKIKNKELIFNIDTFDIRPLIKAVVEVYRYMIDDMNREIKYVFPERMSKALIDQNRMIQVLYNLMDIGMKYAPKASITVVVEEEEAYIKFLIVIDTSQGINDNYNIEKYFIDDNKNDYVKDMEQGLRIRLVKSILEGQKGRLMLEQSETNQDITLVVRIPRSKEDGDELVAIDNRNEMTVIPKSEEIIDTTKRPVILLVDDDIIHLKGLKSILMHNYYKLRVVNSATEALEYLSNSNIDLVLVNSILYDMSSYELCRKIRKVYAIHQLPIIILGGGETLAEVKMGFSVGANDFVVKPFVKEQILTRIENLLMLKEAINDAWTHEMAFLQAQIKPHFLYNALNTIMSFCYTDGEKAGELLGDLSNYLQKSFNINHTLATVSIKREISLITAYTNIEKARFGDRLDVVLNVDEGVDEHYVLPLTIQPLVENAIRHGLMSRAQGGCVIVNVQMNKKQDEILVIIEDDGIGIEDIDKVLALEYDESKGVGLRNIKERLKQYYNSDLTIVSEVNKGTKVSFTIPITSRKEIAND